MPKVIYYVASSLDGFIATEDNSLDWLLQFGFEAFQAHYDRFIAGVGAVVMGGETYRWLRTEEPDNWSYRQPCWVLTSREESAPPQADVRFASGDVREVLAAARDAAGERDVWLVGGGNVAAQFADAGLLDELWVTYMPVALGTGRRLLPVDGPTPPMHLVATTQFNGGAAELRFAVG
ncbi:dihydrofolate reductase family protein [Arthrobacter sp. zg-Y20]|uniref:dihydrofolate reductase family protein n=1 Tax=unclassified Arthrobacter TaxID=235627 RepID=UPI001D140DC0|nr:MULTISPECIES: dihydrofolate reductase family protein [unclassified Arthrobacter]MCC3275248.1 dihydrofolate reductase family protein [Arthrobacter sp. zg-Y20]MDK1315405.1 dihydrofolate reductase family protein [Arthrobacter sp. zg.Y20]WIB05822.1 dihydrofolate reductase family protein [Arthrobacter sp. zg-Y20]